MFYKEGRYLSAAGYKELRAPKYAYTEWMPVSKKTGKLSLTIELEKIDSIEEQSLVLGIGIRFATIGPDGEPLQLKSVGAGKILGVVGRGRS